jgi:hypothetical protein
MHEISVTCNQPLYVVIQPTGIYIGADTGDARSIPGHFYSSIVSLLYLGGSSPTSKKFYARCARHNYPPTYESESASLIQAHAV